MTDPFWLDSCEPAGDYHDRDEWLTLRGTGIGSSDCSAILGLGKYGSPWSVWLEKTGRAKPVEETEAMMWGTLLEPVIRSELARRLGATITERPLLRSRQRPWQLYSPDGIAETLHAVVEIKNASAWLAQEWNDQIPDHAELQVQHGMAVTGAAGAYVAGLIGGNRLRWEYIPRDDQLIDIINGAEHRFWHEHVLADTEPPIDGSDATADAIGIRWPRRPEAIAVYEDTLDVDAAVDAYRAALESEKAARADKAKAVNELAALMRGCDAIADKNGRKLVAIKRGQFREKAFRDENDGAPEWLHKTEVVDRDRLKAEEPDLYRQYQATSIYIPKGT